MLRRGVIALGLAAVAVGVAGAASQPADGNGGAGARAYAIRLVLPNEAQPIVVAEATSPPNGTGFEQAYAYPADGSAVKTGALTTSASSSPGPTSTAQAASGVAALSLFNGELTADTVSGRARATATQKASSGDLATGTGFTNLTVLGQVLPQPTPNQRVALADWGYAILLEQPPETASAGQARQGYHGFVTALDVHLTADHGGLVAGSEIQVGYAEANAQPARTPQPGPATQ